MKSSSYTISLTLDETVDLIDLETNAIVEGIDVEFKYGKGFVSFNDSHEKGVNTSLKDNPTSFLLKIDQSNFDVKEVEVYSIFKRVSGNPGDGNSLIFALKDEKNFLFKHGEKEKIMARVAKIISKFLDIYVKKIGSKFSTIVLPSGKSVNSEFANLLKRIAEKKHSHEFKLYDDVFMKIPVDLIRSLVQYDAGSEYNKWLHGFSTRKIEELSTQFDHDLAMMDEKRRGYFTYHMISNPDIRNMISSSLSVCDSTEYSNAFGPINDQHILMIDDLISRGSTIKDAIRNLCNCYHPKSITVLTLLSKKY